MPTSVLLRVFVLFAPAVASVGSALKMSQVYARSFSKTMGACTVFAWIALQMCMGIALLLYVDALDSDEITTLSAYASFIILPLLVLLWLVSTVAFLWHEFLVATGTSVFNLLVHFIAVGMILNATHNLAFVLALCGSAWCAWTLVFALSFALYIRRDVVRPIGRKIMAHLRNSETVMDSLRRKQITTSTLGNATGKRVNNFMNV